MLPPPRRQTAAEDATSRQPLSGPPCDPIFHITRLHCSPCGGFTSKFSEKNRFLLVGLLSRLWTKIHSDWRGRKLFFFSACLAGLSVFLLSPWSPPWATLIRIFHLEYRISPKLGSLPWACLPLIQLHNRFPEGTFDLVLSSKPGLPFPGFSISAKNSANQKRGLRITASSLSWMPPATSAIQPVSESCWFRLRCTPRVRFSSSPRRPSSRRRDFSLSTHDGTRPPPDLVSLSSSRHPATRSKVLSALLAAGPLHLPVPRFLSRPRLGLSFPSLFTRSYPLGLNQKVTYLDFLRLLSQRRFLL